MLIDWLEGVALIIDSLVHVRAWKVFNEESLENISKLLNDIIAFRLLHFEIIQNPKKKYECSRHNYQIFSR